jgi:hypothetical protein
LPYISRQPQGQDGSQPLRARQVRGQPDLF